MDKECFSTLISAMICHKWKYPAGLYLTNPVGYGIIVTQGYTNTVGGESTLPEGSDTYVVE